MGPESLRIEKTGNVYPDCCGLKQAGYISPASMDTQHRSELHSISRDCPFKTTIPLEDQKVIGCYMIVIKSNYLQSP